MFSRQSVRNHASSTIHDSSSLVIRGIADKRRKLQKDLRAGLGKKKLKSEELKNRSLFLNRKEKKCFYGCQFYESLKNELYFLSEKDIKIIANLLFEHNYIVPVMQYVTEMSNSTVYYRYAEDSLQIKESLKYEICDSRHFAEYLMQQTLHPYLTGYDIYRLLERHIMECSPELVVTPLPSKEANRKLRNVCQTMLMHGNLVPVEKIDPEKHQIFSFRYKYYLCNSNERMSLIQEFQLDPGFDVIPSSSGQHKHERKTFSLSRAFTSAKGPLKKQRKCDEDDLYWTLDHESLDSHLTKEIVTSPDVAVLKQSSVLLPSYRPPTASTHYSLVFRKVCEKLISSSCNKIRYEKTSIESISSIDAEWSVY